MRHHFIDYHSGIPSPIRSLDPRVKIIISFAALVAVVATPNGRFADYCFFAPAIIALICASKIPPAFIMKRMLTLLPLVAIIAASLPFISPGKPIASFKIIIPLSITDAGLINFVSVIIKAALAIWIMTLLISTTEFRDLLSGMQKLKIPSIFISILGFMYRYIFLFIDEAERLSCGRRARSFGRRPLLEVKGFAWMISSLFIRSFERAERVYHAMCSRGFAGSFMTTAEMKIKARDIAACAASIGVIIAIKIAGYLI